MPREFYGHIVFLLCFIAERDKAFPYKRVEINLLYTQNYYL